MLLGIAALLLLLVEAILQADVGVPKVILELYAAKAGTAGDNQAALLFFVYVIKERLDAVMLRAAAVGMRMQERGRKYWLDCNKIKR